jgi:hypothetical protein
LTPGIGGYVLIRHALVVNFDTLLHEISCTSTKLSSSSFDAEDNEAIVVICKELKF